MKGEAIMWKSLKTLMEIVAELPNEAQISAQAMPQTHYLNGKRGVMGKLPLLPSSENKQPAVEENEADTLVLIIPSLQNLR